MNDSVKRYLDENSALIIDLAKNHRHLIPLATRSVRRAISIYDLLIEGALTNEQIAEELGIHKSTVEEYVTALQNGRGLRRVPESPTREGRPRTLVVRE